MEQLVASLEAQKQEKDEELQAQRHLVQTLQKEMREKEQETQSLREMVVHLRTRVRLVLQDSSPSLTSASLPLCPVKKGKILTFFHTTDRFGAQLYELRFY